MRINRLRLESYGPFEDSSWIELSPTMNIFVGENNAGKSAILRSFLGSGLPALPHRNATEWRQEYLSVPKLNVEIEYSGPELEWQLRKLKDTGNGWLLATPNITSELDFKTYTSEYLQHPIHKLAVSRSPNVEFVHSKPLPAGPKAKAFTLHFYLGNWKIEHGNSHDPVSNLPSLLTRIWDEKVFVFEALRSSPGKMSYAPPGRLDPNAGSLAVELNGLQGDSPELFAKLVLHLTTIFPTVGNLSVSAAGSVFEIRVWATREQKTRDLSFSLNDSGTGLAQAIAILFIAMTMNDSVLVIDEISSYLHPAAAKALLRILQSNYPQHQYIISTHSPEVLSTGRDAKVFWVRKHDFESSVTEVDLGDLQTLREVTGQLGVSMTDMFGGAEHIIWVDGQTEEACFPMLLAKSKNETRSVQFIALLATGDVHDKKVKPEKVFQIYERLTSVTAPVVSKVAFNFDTDDLNDDRKIALNHRSGNRILFLPRRNLECYLLKPEAIARVIVDAVKHVQTLDEAQIEAKAIAALQEAAGAKQYGKPSNPPAFNDKDWLARVDGATVLSDVFAKVTGQTLEFRKTTHSVALVKDLLERQPEELHDLIVYIDELVTLATQN